MHDAQTLYKADGRSLLYLSCNGLIGILRIHHWMFGNFWIYTYLVISLLGLINTSLIENKSTSWNIASWKKGILIIQVHSFDIQASPYNVHYS